MNNNTCSHPGCSRPRGNNGTLSMCSAHNYRRRTGRDMDAPILDKRRGTLFERFLRFVPDAPFTPYECWEWTGRRNELGYGLMREAGKASKDVRAHRVSYSYFHATSEDITAWVVLHTCDNASCVNPYHLRLGTQGDNMRDKSVKLRARGNSTLTEEQVRTIKSMFPTHTDSQIATAVGTTRRNISRIRKGEYWNWVE